MPEGILQILERWIPIAISLLALAMAVRADRRTRTLERIDRMPHLDVFTSLGHNQRFDFRVNNNGLGPAKICKAYFVFEERQFPMDSSEALNRLFGDFDIPVVGRTLSEMTVIAPGSERTIVDYDPIALNAEGVTEVLRSRFSEIGYVIEYDSLDGERYIEQSSSLVAGE